MSGIVVQPIPHEVQPPFPNDVATANIRRISLRKLEANDDEESRSLFEACREYGFFHLDLRNGSESKGSGGISLLSALEPIFELNRELHELPEDEKQRSAYAPPKQLFGYKALGRNRVEGGDPDRYEAWTLARDDIVGLPPPAASDVAATPARPPLGAATLQRRGQLRTYVRAAHGVVALVCAHLDCHLRLPPGTLAGLQRLDQPSQTSLRLLRYLPHSTVQGKWTPRKSLVGHTDIGTITILAHNGVGGLQVLPPGKANSEENWAYVRPEEGCVIVNLGDAMTEWSGGILRSDLHRVVAAPGGQSASVRYSIAYLVRPESHAHMLPLKEEWREESADADSRIWTAIEWERRKSQAIISGTDVARSKGGKAIERAMI